jgi:hypothetical protein
MGITVTINKFPSFQYSEYFLTGFKILKEKNTIDRLKIDFSQNVRPGNLYRVTNKLKKKLFSSNVSNFNNSHLLGTISDGHSTKKFAINILDTPWSFDTNYLENVDSYFKCQYPSDLKKGYFQITQFEKIQIPELVLYNSSKIKPLMLGRPLSRILDFSKNQKILKTYEIKRKVLPREHKILIYFGMANDNEPVPNTHHPHFKRAMIAEWANRNISGAKIIFNLSQQQEFLDKLSPSVKSLEDNSKITDEMYLNLVQSSISTLNITGLRGSVPFRVIDSFLSGMVLISDTMHVDWYEPLIPGKDFLSIGNLGYEKLENIAFEDSCKQLKDYVENIEDFFVETADFRESKFNDYYSPEAVAKHILNENDML